ncbi:MAG: hypothetical protein Q8O62_06015 [Aequorivita sp.]|nr:hypothetical protein [Aequorivita sp.]
MTGYELSRAWFDWCFENPSKAKPAHTAVYFWMIELCNRMGWKEEFGIPSLYSMEATGISSKNTYYKAFHNLEEWGFIQIIERAKNQNTPNIISIVGVSKIKSADIPANKSALDSALIQQCIQQGSSGGNIDKPLNKEQKNQKQENEKKARAIEILKSKKQIEFEVFQMQEKKNIKNWKELEVSFNDKMDLEIAQGKIEFVPDQLMPRFRNYARVWIENQDKYLKNNNQDDNTSYNVPVG